MKRITAIAFILFAVLLPLTVVAQLQFTGELRPRTEFRHGYSSLFDDGAESAIFTSQRTRLNVNYKHADYRVGVSVQDVRVWGDVKQLNVSDNNKLMLHEAWGEITFYDWFSLKLGRQELVYDDHRILGNVGWAQQARSHDLALFKFTAGEGGYLHMGIAYNQDKEQRFSRLYATAGNYKSMQFLWYHRKMDNFVFSLLFINNGFQHIGESSAQAVTRNRQTWGTHMNYNTGKVALAGSLYIQSGEDKLGGDIKAFLLSASMKYPFSQNWKGSLGVEILSGTDSQKQNDVDFDNRSFTPLFGTNHKFNGHMDYFYVGNHVDNVGLQDYFAKLNYGKDKISFASALHIFFTQAGLMSPGTGPDSRFVEMDKYLGTELDLSLGYQFSSNVSLHVGYSHMFDSDTMRALKGTDNNNTNNWGWVMISFKPNFLNK